MIPSDWIVTENSSNNIDFRPPTTATQSGEEQIQESGLLVKKLGITGTPSFAILKNDKIEIFCLVLYHMKDMIKHS